MLRKDDQLYWDRMDQLYVYTEVAVAAEYIYLALIRQRLMVSDT
jgi:hypothetical protein